MTVLKTKQLQFVPKTVARSIPNPLDVSDLVNFLQGNNNRNKSNGGEEERGQVCVITGAGISTESGVPDYRSPQGSYSRGHKPMTHQEFVKSKQLRKRYWARSVVASRHFEQARPNDGHFSLAKMEQSGLLNGIITQNVDRLHMLAGSKNVLELHGHTDGVACLDCQTEFSRKEYHRKLHDENASWFEIHLPHDEDLDVRADGDAHLNVSDYQDFSVPGCTKCDGVLMPTIVFFGGNVPQHVREQSFEMVEKASRLLVVGSSLTVWSSYRLCKAAYEQDKPIAILNAGETRADPICDLKIDGSGAGPLLKYVTEELGL